jgi:peptide/nickel transport system substrate-binding protein
MKRLFSRLAVTSCLLSLAAVVAHPSSRPRYGGTVRVALQHRVNALDPAAEDDYPAARDRMAGLLFETLTSLDEQGRVHPRLALSWRPDPARRIWQFRLRLANFHDGSPLTAADVAASLNRAGGPWRSSASDRQTVTVEGLSALPHLPEMLAMQRFAIVKHTAEGTLVGTGPYTLSEWQPGERAAFSENEDYWGGRAFPEAMEFQMGASLREQLLQRQLSPYSAAELAVDQLHALEQTGQNVDRSRPTDLLVIVFLQPDSPLQPGKKPIDPKIREALANSLDRATINNALLQKKGAPASGLLPQWLTGYEFLFPGAQDRSRARKLASSAVLPGAPITLAYDFSDPVAKLVAERVALDAREVGITLRPYGENRVNTKSARAGSNADAVLLRLPLPSLEPSVALATVAGDLGFTENTAAMLSASRPEDLFELERKTLENFRVIPVARLSLAVWLNSNLHNWQQLPTGEWDLDEIWTEAR